MNRQQNRGLERGLTYCMFQLATRTHHPLSRVQQNRWRGGLFSPQSGDPPPPGRLAFSRGRLAHVGLRRLARGRSGGTQKPGRLASGPHKTGATRRSHTARAVDSGRQRQVAHDCRPLSHGSGQRETSGPAPGKVSPIPDGSPRPLKSDDS